MINIEEWEHPEQPKWKIEYLNKEIKERKDIGQVSDGYHTFDELYDHRIILYLSLVDSYSLFDIAKPVWSDTHHDGTKWDGWLIVSVYLETIGQISYHISEKYRYLLEESNIRFVEIAPEWDGHTSEDVLDRLVSFNFGLDRRKEDE